MKPESLQVISRNGEPEYAVLPWAEYQALLRAAEGGDKPLTAKPLAPVGRMPGQAMPAAADPFEPSDLVRLRKASGMSQSQLARKTRLGMALLLQIESGQRQPTAQIRQTLAAALGVETL